MVSAIKVKNDTYSFLPQHEWLAEQDITHFRGGKFNRAPRDYATVFRFEKIEDAVAFKLRWA